MRRQSQENEAKRVLGRSVFVLKSYFSNVNTIKPVFLCLLFVCHIFFYPSTFKYLCLFIVMHLL